MEEGKQNIGPRTLENNAGFSIMEVLISMAILAIGLLAISLMQGHFAGGNASSRQIVRATDIAMAHIEDLTNIDNLGDADISTGFHTRTITTYPIDYTLEWIVTDNGDGTLGVAITVRWQQENRNHSMNFSWIKSA